ncbi:MAG: hypothetical protein V4633_16585 [Pseudomonadota bacterium]
MSRPPFILSDDQARRLGPATVLLCEQFPVDRHGHRPFVAGFVRAVFDVTGRTFSPSIYRRLLSAYAAGRSPSTTTLALEKKLLEQELAKEALAAAPLPPNTALPACVEDTAAAVRQVMAEYLPLFAEHAAARAPEQQDAHFAYLVGRLAESENANAGAKAVAAREAAELQAALGAASILQDQLAIAQAALAEHAGAAARMADEMAEMRKFTLMSIEGARGETRDLKEVCRQLRADLAMRDNELDALRRLGYRQAVSATPNSPGSTR